MKTSCKSEYKAPDFNFPYTVNEMHIHNTNYITRYLISEMCKRPVFFSYDNN